MAAASDEDELVWYGAIGSMMCRKALELRGIHPVESLACELRGYRRVFYAPGGAATIWPAPESHVDAVVHAVTRRELAILEAREPPSQQLTAHIATDRKRGVDGAPEGSAVPAFVSVATWTKEEALPTQRYIALMVDGARDARMREERIDVLLKTPAQPPSRGAMRFELDPSALVVGSTDKLLRLRRNEVRGQAQHVIFRNKVLKRVQELAHGGSLLATMDFRGADMTHWMTRQYYNPEFGHPDDNLENERYWAWLESHAATFLLKGWKQVGVLEPEDATIEDASGSLSKL